MPWDDGTLLVGATVEEAGFDERATVAGVRDLLDAACEIVPHAWTAGFRGARVGLRPATTDDLPVIGASAALPNLMYATGHYRNGVLLAPLTAQLVADAMLDNRIDPLLAAVGPSPLWRIDENIARASNATANGWRARARRHGRSIRHRVRRRTERRRSRG